MRELTLKTNKTIDDYSEGIGKLLFDIADEIKNEVKDGIGIKLASQSGDEASVYNFLKNEGYDITYKDFLSFNQDSKKIVEENEDAIKNMLLEQKSEELNDNDLEQVAGGKMKWWQWALIGVGAALVIAAATIVTCGMGTAATTIATTYAIGAAEVATTLAGANVAGFIGAAVGTAGTGAIATGLLTD